MAPISNLFKVLTRSTPSDRASRLEPVPRVPSPPSLLSKFLIYGTPRGGGVNLPGKVAHETPSLGLNDCLWRVTAQRDEESRVSRG